MSPSTSEPARPAKFPASKSSAGAAEATKAGRPKDVADWRLDDYHHASANGDPQLVAAIGYLGGHFSGKESAATLLAALLEPAADDPFAETAAAATVKSGRGNARISISFLQQADSETHRGHNRRPGGQRNAGARQILQDLADGSLKVADGPAAATAAFHALAARAWPGRPRLPIPHGHGGEFALRPRIQESTTLRNCETLPSHWPVRAAPSRFGLAWRNSCWRRRRRRPSTVNFGPMLRNRGRRTSCRKPFSMRATGRTRQRGAGWNSG